MLYVTSELHVDYQKPTPLDQPIHLGSWLEGDPGRKTRIVCELGTDNAVTAIRNVLAVRTGG